MASSPATGIFRTALLRVVGHVKVLSARYAAAAASRPFLTAAATSGSLMTAGDIVAQSLERDQARREGRPVPAHDVGRTFVMASWGLTVLPAVWAPWYPLLDRVISATGLKGALAKALLTAVTMAPLSRAGKAAGGSAPRGMIMSYCLCAFMAFGPAPPAAGGRRSRNKKPSGRLGDGRAFLLAVYPVGQVIGCSPPVAPAR